MRMNSNTTTWIIPTRKQHVWAWLSVLALDMIMTDSSCSFAFSPATLTIKAGTTVVWKNTTQVAHTVTSDDGKSFDSGSSNPIAPQSGTFSFKFATPGTYAYHCTIHPFMKATIIVQ